MALVVRHCETIKQEAAEVARAMESAASGVAGSRSSLVARMHKLKGSSGSIGFMEISGLSGEIEAVLREAGERPLTEPERREIDAKHAALQARVARIEPSQSTLYARLA